MIDREAMVQRQKVLGDFGEFVLCSDDLDAVLTEGCRLVSEALGTGRAKVLEIQDDGRCLFVRAGVGSSPGVVGHLRLEMSERSSETFSVEAGEPVITQDISKEDRFEFPDFMTEAGVVAIANVPIVLPGARTYGLLQVDDTKPREFTDEDLQFLRTYTTILGPVIDRLLNLRVMRAGEERHRLALETARDYAIFTTDLQGRIAEWYEGAEAVFGYTANEIRGRDMAILYMPEDRDAGRHLQELETAGHEGSVPNVRWHMHKDGRRVLIDGRITVLSDGGQGAHGFLKVGQDVTERRASEEWLRTLMEGIPQLVWRSHDEGQWTWASQQWLAFTGQPQEQSHGLGWLDALHPDDREATQEAWSEARSRGMLDVEYRVRRASDGAFIWHHTRSVPVRDDAGAIVEWLGTSTDVQVLKELQERQAVLVAELQHRTRNLVAVVRSIFDKSARGSSSLDTLAATFRDRLDALARIQGLLSRLEPDDRVTFDELIRTELGAMGMLDQDGHGERVTIDGPEGVRLRSSTVQTFALALHELATNAAKYGALKQQGARLSVRWHMLNGDDPRLRVEWSERGVEMPKPGMAPTGTGYGRELIERALPYQLDAQTTYELGEDGVRCTITLPVSGTTSSSTKAVNG